MTLIEKSFSYPDILRLPVNSSSIVMDATGERCGHVQYIKDAGDIAKVLFYNAAITTGDTIKASIQTVDMTTGLPTGTIWPTATGNKAFGTVAVSTGATGWSTVTFDEVATVVQGDLIAVVFEWNSYVAGNMRFYGNIGSNSSNSQYAVTDITASPGTWAKSPSYSTVVCCLEYSGGVYHQNFNNNTSGASAPFALKSDSTPDEVGNYFQVPYTMRAYGFWVYIDLDENITLSLQASDGTVLANCVLDKDIRNATAAANHYIVFDQDPATSVTLLPSTWYRMVVTPNTTTTTNSYFIDVPSAASMNSLDGGTLCYATSRVDGGAWTQLTTRRWAISLLIDAVDIGSGAGTPSVFVNVGDVWRTVSDMTIF